MSSSATAIRPSEQPQPQPQPEPQPSSASSRAEINRANAQHSTGPKTATGKAISSRNAATHGLTSSRVVLRNDEERAAFAAFEAAIAKEILPAAGSTLQAFHFDRLVAAAWNIDRCDRVHAELISASAADPLLDTELSKTVHNIELYRRRSERSYLMAAKQIRELQAETLFRDFIIGPEATVPETFGIGILTPLKKTREQYADDEANTNRRHAEQRERARIEAGEQFAEAYARSFDDVDDDDEDENANENDQVQNPPQAPVASTPAPANVPPAANFTSDKLASFVQRAFSPSPAPAPAQRKDAAAAAAV